MTRDPGSLERALREASDALLRRIEDLSLIRLLGDALAGEVEPAAIGRGLVGLLREELGVDLAALWTVDEAGGGLRLTAVARAGEAPVRVDEGPLVPFSTGGLGRAGAGETVRVTPPDAGDGLPADVQGLGVVLLHPVGARGRTLGVVGLGAASGDAVGAEHERLLGLVAPAVAMALENAGLYARLVAENRTLRAELRDRFGATTLIGASPPFRRLLAATERLAEADITVLVLGASGTGKEAVARALHYGGKRREGPFVPVNCAALPEGLLESELLGIERGVATGVERRAGLVERADRGTLFLDEIGDMSLAVQAKVLRVLQEREVMRIGGTRALPVDVRVVAATHRDLEAAVRDGRFREDLYFRLKVATLQVPALAERREDVPLLAHHFFARAVARHARPELRLAPEALAALAARPWPGNVRELENVIEQAVVMAEGPTVGLAEIGLTGAPAPPPGLDYRHAVSAAADQAERMLIEQALAATGHNHTRAARLLGIGRRTLLYKLKRYRLGDG